MNKINISASDAQTATCEELEAIAHDYLSIPSSLDDESYGCRAGATLSLPTTITATDGVYNDTKEALEDMGVTVNGTEYVRILDSAARTLILNNVSHALTDRISKNEMASVTDLSFFYQDTTVVFLDLTWFTGMTNCGKGINSMTKLKKLLLPKNLKSTSSTGWNHPGGFNYNSALEDVTIQSSVAFNMEAFRNDSSIRYVRIPSIDVFLKCTYTQGNCHPANGGNATLYLISDPDTPLGTDTTPLTIPSTITAINAYALYNLQSCVNLHYAGKVEDYLAISRGTNWHYNLGTTVVVCDGGDANTNESVTCNIDDTTDTGNTYE